MRAAKASISHYLSSGFASAAQSSAGVEVRGVDRGHIGHKS